MSTATARLNAIALSLAAGLFCAATLLWHLTRDEQPGEDEQAIYR